MKKLYGFIAVLAIFAIFGCAPKPATMPDDASQSLGAKPAEINVTVSATAVTYGPEDFTLGDYSAVWPPADSNLVLWYFGGIYPNDEQQHEYLYGFAILEVDSAAQTAGDRYAVSVTLRQRGEGSLTVAHLWVLADSLGGALLADFPATTDFATLSSGAFSPLPAKLCFVFALENFDPAAPHRDVNIDVKEVVVQTGE